MEGLHHPQLLKVSSGAIDVLVVEVILPHGNLVWPPLSCTSKGLCIFIFILKVPELPRCFGVFELAGELFYFIRSYIQKGFHFEFYHFV